MRLKRTFYLCIVLLVAILIFSGCQQKFQDESKIKIVTTFAPLYSLTLNVTGNRAEVTNLVPIGTSIHAYQSKPSDVKKIAEADILIKNEVGLEEFLEDMVDAASNLDLKVVDTSRGIKILRSTTQTLGEEEHREDHYEDGNPHIWLSPRNAIKQVETIRDALIRADTKNEEAYRDNAKKYIDMLKELDREVRQKFERIQKKKFIVFHDAYLYFEKDYGLNHTAAIEEFPGKEPSPKYLKELVDLIEKGNVKIVFTEPQFSPKVVQTLKEETGVYVAELDPIGSELSKESYVKNIRKNSEAFLKAFEFVERSSE
jgi:ABC-type Zn uptake system ZnuABC Zn-binding protein ZnuA